MRQTTKAVLTLAAAVSMAAALAGVAAGPASAKPYPPPSIHLLCTAAPTNGALHGSVCALASGQTTAPNNYSATIAVSRAGTAGPNVTFALTAGSLPPGLTMSASSGTSTAITGNPTQGRDVQLHHQGDRRGPDLHAGLPDHRHRAGAAGPAGVRPRGQRRLPGKRGLRAARRRRRPALPGAPGHQPPGRRLAQRGLRFAAGRPVPARHLYRLRRHRRRYPDHGGR